MRAITLGTTEINDDTDGYVIAEIGHNHQGSVETAKKMFDVARECGVNAVKLQKRDNKTLFTRELYSAPYLTANSYGDTYGAHREALEFNKEQYVELKDYAEEIGIVLFGTAFDMPSVDFLNDLEMPFFKIASADLTNIPLLQHVAETGKPILLSTGGGSLEDVQRAYDAIMPINKQLCVLQCTASYPIEDYRDMNLRVIETYRSIFPDSVIGLSDHESGIAMALVAFALGARIIEKHFTLNRAWHGTDHAFSLSPVGLKRVVRNLKRANLALGNGKKECLANEEKPILKMSKKLVAARNLEAGHVLRLEDVAIKSPGDGLRPYELVNVVGKTLQVSLMEDDNISFEILK